ncbi:visual pigment-like receptor peropsin [Nematostella vectensis]|nr:visual pigment-like receptor peropsin [Nematostella vectensis]
MADASGNTTSVVVTCVYSAYSAITLVLNTLLILVFYKKSLLRRSYRFYIFSLALVDILMAVLVDSIGAYANSSPGRALSSRGCQYYGAVASFVGFTSVHHLTAISADRWYSIRFVMRRKPSKRVTLRVILALWISGLIWAIPPLVGWSSYAHQGSFSHCSVKWFSVDPKDYSYTVVIFTKFYFFPIAFMTFSYVHVFVITRRMAKNATQLWGKKAAATAKSIKSESKAAEIALVMVLSFLIAWTPYAVVSFYYSLRGPTGVPLMAAMLPSLFAKASSLFNPIIYFAMSREFRNSCRDFARR